MNDNKPFVSIVIPCLNEEKNIGQCIDSIKQQNWEQYEIIAIDNGSIDDTIRIIKEHGIILGKAKRKGPAAAKNKGIEKAKGDIIIFIDADCVAHPAWLVNMIKLFEDHSIGCVAGEIVGFEPRTELERFLIKKGHLSQFKNVNHSFLPYAATANVAYRRDVFDRAGLFDEDLFTGEDADMSWRMQLKADYKLTYSPQAIVYHLREVTLKGLFRQKLRHADGAVALYKKYKNLWSKQNIPLKMKYWEYRSILKRLMRIGMKCLLTKNYLNDVDYNTILEAGWKAGLIKGSIRYRVWYV